MSAHPNGRCFDSLSVAPRGRLNAANDAVESDYVVE
jgi:hypothetical protein